MNLSQKVVMSEKSDEKKEKKLATVIVGLFSLEKRRLKMNNPEQKEQNEHREKRSNC